MLEYVLTLNLKKNLIRLEFYTVKKVEKDIGKKN